MSKNLVICLDGTWNDDDSPDTLSNVALLRGMCVDDGARQMTYYDPGVGTDGWYDRKLGGVHGIGLSRNIREAYVFLAEKYADGDHVYLFGFSRGAYTARSLAGLLYGCGLPTDSNSTSAYVDRIYAAYRDRDGAQMDAFKSSSRRCPVEFIGVWDTVGALGIPVSFLQDASSRILSFHDTKLSPEVKYACHAVACDEMRKSFEPALWQQTQENRHRVKQVWFPGVHSDVGGGYSERHHSDVALEWMVDQAKQCGLLISEEHYYEYSIDLTKNIHESAFSIFGKTILAESRHAPATGTSTTRVHWSVREKRRLTGSYSPRALAIADFTTLAPYAVEEKNAFFN